MKKSLNSLSLDNALHSFSVAINITCGAVWSERKGTVYFPTQKVKLPFHAEVLKRKINEKNMNCSSNLCVSPIVSRSNGQAVGDYEKWQQKQMQRVGGISDEYHQVRYPHTHWTWQ